MRGTPAGAGEESAVAEAGVEYTALEQDIVASRLRWQPALATALGRHEHDAELGDCSLEAFAARQREVAAQIERLREIHDARLAEPYRTRHGILLCKLRYEHANEGVFGDSRHSPAAGLATAGSACLSLIDRDFAPLEERARALAARLGGVRPLLAQLRQRFEHCSPIHAGTALQQGAGTVALLERDLPAAMAALENTALAQAVEQARVDALDAARGHLAWLRRRGAAGGDRADCLGQRPHGAAARGSGAGRGARSPTWSPRRGGSAPSPGAAEKSWRRRFSRVRIRLMWSAASPPPSTRRRRSCCPGPSAPWKRCGSSAWTAT